MNLFRKAPVKAMVKHGFYSPFTGVTIDFKPYKKKYEKRGK